jgi:hypothetical protein
VKRRAFVSIAACVVAFVVGGAVAYGQTVTADIGFPFVAGGKEMAAGKYSVEVTASGQVTLTAPDRTRVLLPIVTMLGRHDRDADPEFVFDRVGGKLTLSEVWMPGRDGCLVLITKESHDHVVLGGSNPRK